jgi:hypothetical protein
LLGQGIRALREQNVIDGRLFDWSQQLQAFRNLAAHPEDIAISREDAEDLQTFVYAIGLVLQVSDEVQAGVAFIPGQRRDDETVSGTVNMLCSDRYTDMGDGATYQSTWLDVTAWDADELLTCVLGALHRQT